MGTYIPRRRLDTLHTYRYSGEDHSLVSRYLLTPYWNWLVQRFPTWVAPNTITLLGLGLVAANYLTLLALDPGLACGTSKAPSTLAVGGARNALFGRGGAAAGAGAGASRANPSSSVFPVVRLLPNAGFPAALDRDDVSAGVPSSCIPSWVYFTWALCLFAYQSLDSIDGKQARRTGMAGPLGELFDHGCDALNTTLSCMLCASALNIGRSYWSVVSVVATLANFYLTTWEEWHTGTLFLSAFSGPVEGILMICAIYLVTSLAPEGPAFWDRGLLDVLGVEGRIASAAATAAASSASASGLSGAARWALAALPRCNVALNDAFLTFAALGLGANVVASYSNVARSRRRRRENQVDGGGDASRRPSSSSPTSTLTPALGLLPMVLQLGAAFAWLTANDDALLRDARAFPCFVLAHGVLFSYTVGVLIVSHVTRAPFPYWNVAILAVGLGALDARLPGGPWLQTDAARVELASLLLLGFALVLYAHFVHDVVGTITRETRRPCFRVLDAATLARLDAGRLARVKQLQKEQ